MRGRTHTPFTADDNLHDRYHDLFLDTPACQRWFLDTDLANKAGIELLSRQGWQLYWLGPSKLPDILSAYTDLTGRADLPPLCRWAISNRGGATPTRGRY